MLWSRKPFIAVRLLAKSGWYPAFEVRRSEHLFLPSQRRVLAAVVQQPLSVDYELGEIHSLVPEEVRLFSALTLCERDPWSNGTINISHWVEAYVDPEIVGFDLTSTETVEHLESEIAEQVGRSVLWNTAPSQPEGDYRLTDCGTRESALALLDAIDTSDQLLLAGLARLLGSIRLMTALREPEESALALFVSMGAAMEFIRLHLESERSTSVRFEEVYAFVRRTFPHGEIVAEFFEEMYDLRVIATHPANRFGEFWAAPVMASDLFELRKSVMALYRYILVGDIPDP